MRIDVRRAGERFVTVAPGRTTRHSFSFDRHYDPANVEMGFLVCLNDDVVQPGSGYPDHPHRELEIVTWVLEGELRHEDSTGRGGTMTPGLLQRLCAGSGLVHSEVNAGVDPVHFVQMWVRPGESGLPPTYDHAVVDPRGGWLTLASGIPAHRGSAAVPISNDRAGLHGARLADQELVRLPEAPMLHLFVARGRAELEGTGELGPGDAVRLFAGGGQRLTAVGDAEVLAWEMR